MIDADSREAIRRLVASFREATEALERDRDYWRTRAETVEAAGREVCRRLRHIEHWGLPPRAASCGVLAAVLEAALNTRKDP